MAANALGPLSWSVNVDEDSGRSYKIKWLVQTDSPDEGPAIARKANGVPVTGASWNFPPDTDLAAICQATRVVQPVLKGEPNCLWTVENEFKTVSIDDSDSQRCQDTEIENPLLEPDRISGSFAKFTREAQYDRNNEPIANSSLQPYTGPIVEVDDNRPTVVVEKNVAVNPIDVFAPMVDTVNQIGMWGLPPRTVKLSNVSWQRKRYGVCFFYYTVSYEFEVRFDTFDISVVDKGTMKLREGGDPLERTDYELIRDENTGDPLPEQYLDGSGGLLTDPTMPFIFDFEIYEESNFFLLGIPASL